MRRRPLPRLGVGAKLLERARLGIGAKQEALPTDVTRSGELLRQLLKAHGPVEAPGSEKIGEHDELDDGVGHGPESGSERIEPQRASSLAPLLPIDPAIDGREAFPLSPSLRAPQLAGRSRGGGMTSSTSTRSRPTRRRSRSRSSRRASRSTGGCRPLRRRRGVRGGEPAARGPGLVDGDDTSSIRRSSSSTSRTAGRRRRCCRRSRRAGARAHDRGALRHLLRSHQLGDLRDPYFKRATARSPTELLARAGEQLAGVQRLARAPARRSPWFNGDAFGWGDLSRRPVVAGSGGFGFAPPCGLALSAWHGARATSGRA